jgi:hypothetical protein
LSTISTMAEIQRYKVLCANDATNTNTRRDRVLLYDCQSWYCFLVSSFSFPRN